MHVAVQTYIQHAETLRIEEVALEVLPGGFYLCEKVQSRMKKCMANVKRKLYLYFIHKKISISMQVDGN